MIVLPPAVPVCIGQVRVVVGSDYSAPSIVTLPPVEEMPPPPIGGADVGSLAAWLVMYAQRLRAQAQQPPP